MNLNQKSIDKPPEIIDKIDYNVVDRTKRLMLILGILSIFVGVIKLVTSSLTQSTL